MNFDRIIRLTSGAGNGVDTACLMTASNMLIGKGDRGDAVTCQCTVLRDFIVRTNDAMPDDLRSELYGPLVYEILGTRTGDRGVLVDRAFAFADWAVRTIAPRALDGVSPSAAARLRELPQITSPAAASRAADAADAADAARAAAYAADAARAAAYAADAARDAVYAAAASADAAARAAVYAAARAAAYAAADAVWRQCPVIIRRVAAIGDRRPVETCITVDELAAALQ